MKAGIYYTASGPLAILTSLPSLTAPELVQTLHGKGIDTFLAWEVPLGVVQERYGSHYAKVMGDLHESDELRILDDDGPRVFRLFRPSELGTPLIHERSA